MPENYRQDPLPFLGDGVYNQNEAGPTGHSESEILHDALDLLVLLVDWMERRYPAALHEFDDFLQAVSRETRDEV